MNHGLKLMALGLFCFGCAGPQATTAAVTSPAALTKPATVIHDSEAVQAAPPSQKATITHLAEGVNAYLGRLWLAAGAQVPLHRDPTEEYLYILEGSGELTMDGQTYQLQPGHAVYMPAGAEVTFKNGDQPLMAVQIFAGSESAKKYEKWGPVKASPTQP